MSRLPTNQHRAEVADQDQTEQTSEQGMLGYREALCDVNGSTLRGDKTAPAVCAPNSRDANSMTQRLTGQQEQANPQPQA